MRKRRLLVLIACVATIFLLTTAFQDPDLVHATAFGNYEQNFLNDKAKIDRQTSKNSTSVTTTAGTVAAVALVDEAVGVDALVAEALAGIAGIVVLIIRAAPTPEEVVFNKSCQARDMMLNNLD